MTGGLYFFSEQDPELTRMCSQKMTYCRYGAGQALILKSPICSDLISENTRAPTFQNSDTSHDKSPSRCRTAYL